jgi:serine/threonine protein kinase
MLLKFNYGPAVDWWALGIVMYEMMVGRHHFLLPRTFPYPEKIFMNELIYPLKMSCDAVYIRREVRIYNIKTEALGVPYSFLKLILKCVFLD